MEVNLIKRLILYQQNLIKHLIHLIDTMRIFNFGVILFCVLNVISSCHYKSNNESIKIKDTILTGYFTGDFETNIRISCNKISSITDQKGISVKTVKLSKYDFLVIRNFIENDTIVDNFKNCDCRLYLRFKSKGVCIGVNSCVCNINNTVRKDDLYAVYLIKCKSGYFNYFPKEKLLKDKAILKYGIPKDYYYQQKSPIEREEFEKIIFIEK